MAKMHIKDRNIITKSFRLLSRGLPPTTLLEEIDWSRKFNVFSSATGDNRYINPAAQSSPACDPRYGRFMTSYEGGMGSMYKELYEDNVTLLTITPGVAQFAGLLSFITNMFSPTAAIIANKGRAPGLSFYVGQATGSVLFYPMQLLSIGIQFLAYLADSPKHNFFTVKPAMGAYTMAATGVLNDVMIKLGFIDPVLPPNNQEDHDNRLGKPPGYNNEKAVENLSVLMPDVINKDGTIDLMRLVMKGTRKHRALLNSLAALDGGVSSAAISPEEKSAMLQETIQDFTFTEDVLRGRPSQDFVELEMNSVSRVRGPDEASYPEQESAYLNQQVYSELPNEKSGLSSVGSASAAVEGSTEGGRTLSSIIEDTNREAETFSQSYGSTPEANTDIANPLEPNVKPKPATKPDQKRADEPSFYFEDKGNQSGFLGDVADLLRTAANGGMDGMTWRVDGGGGSISDSFSNSTAQSPMADKFNSMVKEANNFKFDVAGGATGIGIVDSLIDTFKEGVMGLAAGTVIGNLPLALAGNAYIKVPEHWDSSTSSLHKESYTLNFRCTYAHPFEQIMKIWVPFACFLPLVAPFSSGASSHTSPFYVKAFCQSRQIIRTGLVESCTFTFGDGEGGWTTDRKPLNLKIELSIVNLEPLVSVPIDRSFSVLDITNPSAIASRLFNDDSAYNDYLGRLTGLSYLDTVLKYARLNRNLTKMSVDMKTSMSANNIAAKINDTPIKDFFYLFTKPIQR